MITAFIKFIAKILFCIIIFGLFSCHSSPEDANHLMDYSNILLSKMTIYDIEITIFNKNITMLKQNIFNEIIENDGKLIHEEIQNTNSYRIVINMPKNNTANFISKIRTFGVVVNENIRGNDVGRHFNDTEMRLINIKNNLQDVFFRYRKC